MTRVRTYLNQIRAEQLTVIAQHHGFDSIANYLDDHITQEWKKLRANDLPSLPSFEIYRGDDGGEPTVFFAANGVPPITISSREAIKFSDGIKLVLNDRQKTFFIASTIDTSILFFGKKGNGYQFIIKWDGGEWKQGLTKSIAIDLSTIFKHYAET